MDGAFTTGSAEVGTYAAAKARPDEQGRFHAQDVSVLPPPREVAIELLPGQGPGISTQPPGEPSGYPVEFRGLIEGIDPRYWMVGSHMVLITAQTSVEGQPQLGAMAEVKGLLLHDGIVLARSIRVTAPGALAEVEFEGRIESISENLWVVDGTTVKVHAATAILGTPAVGAIAEVRGLLQPDDSVMAQQIVVRHPGIPFLTAVEGVVEGIEATHWVIAGEMVVLDSSSFIDDSRAPAEVGMWALAEGFPQQGASLLAVRIRLSRPD
jgi:hypothetical protein